MKLTNLILSTAITVAFADSVCKDVNGLNKCDRATAENNKSEANENGIVPSDKVKGTPLNAIYF